MQNLLIDFLKRENLSASNIDIFGLEKLYEPKKDKFVPMEFYCIEILASRAGCKPEIINIPMEVEDNAAFERAVYKLESLIKDAYRKGFDLKYTGPKNAREKVALKRDVRPEQLPKGNYQVLLNHYDQQQLIAFRKRALCRK